MEGFAPIEHTALKWIPLLPLIGAFINGIITLALGRDYDIVHAKSGRFMRRLTGGIACGAMLLSFIISVNAVMRMIASAASPGSTPGSCTGSTAIAEHDSRPWTMLRHPGNGPSPWSPAEEPCGPCPVASSPRFAPPSSRWPRIRAHGCPLRA